MNVTLSEKEYLNENIEATIVQFVDVIKNHSSEVLYDSVVVEVGKFENRCDAILYLVSVFEELLHKELIEKSQLNNAYVTAKKNLQSYVEWLSESEDSVIEWQDKCKQLESKLNNLLSAEALRVRYSGLESEIKHLEDLNEVYLSQIKEFQVEKEFVAVNNKLMQSVIVKIERLLVNFKKSIRQQERKDPIAYISKQIEFNQSLFDEFVSVYERGTKNEVIFNVVRKQFEENLQYLEGELSLRTSSQPLAQSGQIEFEFDNVTQCLETKDNMGNDHQSKDGSGSAGSISPSVKVDQQIVDFVAALKYVPTFDGEGTRRREKIGKFMIAVESAMRNVPENQIPEFIRILCGYKLEGQAYQVCRMFNFENLF